MTHQTTGSGKNFFRLRIRIAPVSFIALCLFASSLGFPAKAQEAVFLIRHAERHLTADGGLTEKGRQRAERWANVFADADLDVIITSETARTRETAQPSSEKLGLPAQVIRRSERDKLIELLHGRYANDRVLIVGHSGTIPEILNRLGHPEKVYIRKSDYNDLFVARPSGDGSISVVRLNID